MSNIISTKDGRLHIYVRQDKYKGKLKSENWVGRTFYNGKQKVISSGTTDLEEAKKILEQWYDDLIAGKLEENLDNNINNNVSKETENLTTNIEETSKENTNEIKKETPKQKNDDQVKEVVTPVTNEEKKKKLFNFDLSSLKNLSTLKDKFSLKKAKR